MTLKDRFRGSICLVSCVEDDEPWEHAAMSADDRTSTYEARITVVPYAGRALPHLNQYLDHVLTGVVGAHRLVRSVAHDVESGPEYDTVTAHVRFDASTEAEASAITRMAGEAVGNHDEHWRLVGSTLAHTDADS